MSVSPIDAMKLENRSSETFFDWFSRVAKVDFFSGDPEDLRKFLKSRRQQFFIMLNNAYKSHHEQYPGGFSIPPLTGRRPLFWERMGTGGGKRMGGIDKDFAYFGPLVYDGIIFTDNIRLPASINQTRPDNEIEGQPAHDQFLAFMDILIDYAPLFQTGQFSVVSEAAAFRIADPHNEHKEFWYRKDIEQDIMRRGKEE